MTVTVNGLESFFGNGRAITQPALVGAHVRGHARVCACADAFIRAHEHTRIRGCVGHAFNQQTLPEHLQCRSCWERKADRTGKVPALWSLVRGRGDGL